MKQFNAIELQEFSTEKRVRKTLSREGKLSVDVVFYENGQGTPEHQHKRQDEVFYVLDGTGTMIVDRENLPMKKGDIIQVPSGSKHGIKNDSGAQLSMMFIKNSPASQGEN